MMSEHDQSDASNSASSDEDDLPAAQETEDLSEADSMPKPRRRSVVAPVIIVLALLMAVALNLFGADLDFAFVNIGTLGAANIIFYTGVIWYLRRGPGALKLRLLVGAALLILPMAFFAIVEIDSVSGEMVPHLRFRWTVRPDEDLPQLQPKSDSLVELTESSDDFSEFLGPARLNRLAHIKIAKDWGTAPPKLLWRRRIGAGWSSFSTRGPLAATLEQRGENELVTCYEIQTGDPVWSHSIQTRHETTLGGIGPRSAPTWDGSRVYTQGATGILRAIDGRNGKLLWKVDVREQSGLSEAEDRKAIAWGRSGSPLIVDQLVVIPFGGTTNGKKYSLAAYDKMTGKQVWKGGDRQIGYASPVLATLCGVRQIVSVNEDNVSGHDPRTGKTLWAEKWPGFSNSEANVSQPVVLPENHVLLSKAYGRGSKLIAVSHEQSRWSVKEIWAETRLMKTKFTNVAVFDDYVFGLSDGIMECIDWKQGKSLWKSRKGRYHQGQLLGLADSILVQAEEGYVALMEPSPSGFNELSRLDALDGKTWNNLSFAPPFLLVRNATDAACFELTMASNVIDRESAGGETATEE